MKNYSEKNPHCSEATTILNGKPGKRFRLRFLAPLLLLVFAFTLACVMHPLINAFPYGLTDDDAWFYAGIGYNWGVTGLPTFDGHNPTSGFHLLWGGLLSGISMVLKYFTTARSLHLLAFETVYVFIGLLIAWKCASRILDRFCLFAFTVVSTMLMETLILCVLLFLFVQGFESRKYGGVISFAALFLIPFARIDAVIIPFVCALALIQPGQYRRAASIVGGIILGAVLQFIFFHLLFGHVFSVSSILKFATSKAGISSLVLNLFGPGGHAPGFLLRSMLLALLTVGVIIVVAMKTSGVSRLSLGLTAGTAVFTLIHMFFRQVPFWYYLPAYLVFFHLIAAQTVIKGQRILRYVRYAIFAVLVVFFIHKLENFWKYRAVIDGTSQFVSSICTYVAADKRIYQLDGSGYTGYFSDRSVVNGDGLVNSHDYAIRVKNGQLAHYLDEQHICYIIDNLNRDANESIIDYGGLVVRRSDVREIFRSKAFGLHPTANFILYRRLNPLCNPNQN